MLLTFPVNRASSLHRLCLCGTPMALYRLHSRYVGSILVSAHFREVVAANLIKSFCSSLHDEYLHPRHVYVASVITHTHTHTASMDIILITPTVISP